MSLARRLASEITGRSRLVIVVMLLLTVVVGAGAPMVESESSLDQFQTESPESEKLDYIETNFTTGDDNTTLAQIVVRGDNVLSKESLLATLEFEQRLQNNATVNSTLVENETFGAVSNVVAVTAIRQEQASALQRRGAELAAAQERLQANKTALKTRRQALNETAAQLRGALDAIRANTSLSARNAFERVQANETSANATVTLTDTDFQTFDEAVTRLRTAQRNRNQIGINESYELGTRGVLSERYAAVKQRGNELKTRGQELQNQSAALRADRKALQNAPTPNLTEQVEQLESMNESQIDETVSTALSGGNGGADGPLALMPNTYDTGAATATSSLIVVTQESNLSTAGPAASDANIDAQLAMRELATERNGLSYAVFGSGIIAHETQASQADSMVIVGPLALLFVLIALTVAYRDPLDILLGLLGIGAVLVWTFGFMGWTGIDFNQIFIAVPVLLIGLSIDYAIHTFMRHREERASLADQPDADDGSRHSMLVALSGVGIALLWVTATTVIGFLSNLTSPVPPIRDFGVVSSVGILAALLIFGALIPALKVETDELLERFGFDRQKRAFGTGGGAFSSALALGAKGARRAPKAVIVLIILVSVVSAAGGAQVSTSFEQEDFLADDPPDWMKDLPEPFKPGEYTAKETLTFVNERFIREDSNAEILIEGSVTDPDTLARLDDARTAAANKSVTQTLSNGEPAIDSPLTTMQEVAETNETFNTTFQSADTDGDGVPEKNVTAVYDGLFASAPDRAGQQIYREDGQYQALRLTVSIKGGSSGSDVTTQMRDVAGTIDGEGVTVTATGTAILNKIVQDQLLETVVESLIITLVAVFLFLMATYRVSDGSATLGAVTLLPVAFAVTWILGSMYALGIPFNVITGLITSLTIGLGVAYSIHLSERYTQELENHDTVWAAMERAVTGTGGALLGSAATTVGGFGVLVFAILPPLQQFGLITGLTIIYAFLGSVFILPSLLVVWTRYAGPEWARDQIANGVDASNTSGQSATAGGGGRPGTESELTEFDP